MGIQRTSSSTKEEPVREQSRPAPPSLRAIVDNGRGSTSRGRPSRPQAPSRARPEPVQEQEPERPQPTLPPRLTPVRIQSFITTQEPVTTQRPQRPSRLEIITDRPNIRTSSGGSRFGAGSRFGFGSNTNRFRPTQPPTTTTTT